MSRKTRAASAPPEIDRPTGLGNREMGWGSDVIAEMLQRLDLGYVALNPGASFRGLHDSIVNYLGNQDPEMLLVLHEGHAVAIAHGYAKVTGRPMAVILHSNVGLMNGIMGIYNAWCDRVPMVILGATGAVDAVKRRPWIEWIHTSRDQGALVRNFVKWDDQPASVGAAVESLLRASILTRTPPHAPVYICLDVAVQEGRLTEPPELPDVARYEPGGRPEPSSEALAKAADLLRQARRPVILVGRVSRSREAWDLRVALAERLQAPVIGDFKCGASFPTDHPLHVGAPAQYFTESAAAAVREADVVLSLDWVDLVGTWQQISGRRTTEAQVIHCSIDSQLHNGWSFDHQPLPGVDVPILAEPDAVLAPLLGLLGQTPRTSGQPRSTVPLQNPASENAVGMDAIPLAEVARVFERMRGAREITLVRLPFGWPESETRFSDPLDYLGYDGGGGIGSGLGMAVGAALALKGSKRLAVAILGDGDYVMGVNALWTAAHYRLPLMVIVNNNRSFFNDEMHQERMARQRSRPVENRWIGQKIDDPAVDLAAMARAQGAEAAGPITSIGELEKALARGFDVIEAGGLFVADVRTLPVEQG